MFSVWATEKPVLLPQSGLLLLGRKAGALCFLSDGIRSSSLVSLDTRGEAARSYQVISVWESWLDRRGARRRSKRKGEREKKKQQQFCFILPTELALKKNAVCDPSKEYWISSSYLCSCKAAAETNSILCWPAEARLSSKTLHMEDNSVYSRRPERSSYRYLCIYQDTADMSVFCLHS